MEGGPSTMRHATDDCAGNSGAYVASYNARGLGLLPSMSTTRNPLFYTSSSTSQSCTHWHPDLDTPIVFIRAKHPLHKHLGIMIMPLTQLNWGTCKTRVCAQCLSGA